MNTAPAVEEFSPVAVFRIGALISRPKQSIGMTFAISRSKCLCAIFRCRYVVVGPIWWMAIVSNSSASSPSLWSFYRSTQARGPQAPGLLHLSQPPKFSQTWECPHQMRGPPRKSFVFRGGQVLSHSRIAESQSASTSFRSPAEMQEELEDATNEGSSVCAEERRGFAPTPGLPRVGRSAHRVLRYAS